MNDITPKEAIANLNHIYGMVAPDIQRSLDVAIKCMEEKIDNAPTVEPERSQGHWVVKSNGTTSHYVCSQCGNAGDIQDKFCRECGAPMRGDQK